MAKRVAPKAPTKEDCLRRSIELFGVIHPVVMTSAGDTVDGRLRAEIASDLDVSYRVVIEDGRTPIKVARQVREIRQQEEDERTSALSAQIVRLASEQVDGVGVWPVDILAASLGVSSEHVLHIMRRHLTPTAADVRDMFPAKRRRSDGSVGDAEVTTVDVAPVVEQVPPPEMPELHDLYEFIPPPDPEQRGRLRASLVKHGQRKPIVLDRGGRLVDGRTRWEILTELGVTPVTEVTDKNPWLTALEANQPRFADTWDRVMILVSLPVRVSPTQPDDMRPPTIPDAAQAFGVTSHVARSMRQVVTKGSPELIQAVRDEAIRIGTAQRMIREVPPEQWGARIAAAYAMHAAGGQVTLPMHPGRTVAPAPRPRGAPRGDVVTDAVAEQAIAALEALGMVLDGAGGLDPRITREQAGDLLSRLSTARRPLGRLTTMLKQRKETT